MKDYQQRVNELYNQLDDIAANRNTVYAEIGRTLYRSHPNTIEAPDYQDLVTQITAQNDEISKIAATVTRLEEIGERMKVLGLDRGDKEEKKGELQQELRPHYRTIGETAFRLFRENPLIDSKYTEIFQPLSENYDEVRQLERELAALHGEQAKRPFVERLMKRGRDLLLKSRIQAKQEKRDALHEEAGKKLAETDFIALIDDPDLNEAAEPYRNIAEQISAIDEQIVAIDKEIQELNAEQQEKSGGKRLQRAFSDLKESRELRESQQEELFSQLGRRFAEARGEEVEVPQDLESYFEELRQLRRKEADSKGAIERLEAALKIQELANRIRQTEEEKARQQKKLEKIRQSIEELDKEVDYLEQERGRMEEIRGSEDDLSAL